MSAWAIVAITILSCVVLLVLLVAGFRGWRWIEDAIEEEMNAIAPAPCGHSRGEQREDAR